MPIPPPCPCRSGPPLTPPTATHLRNIQGGATVSIVEPALKVSFADGNRELLLHYQSHTATAQGFDVVLKDISLNILVTLHYSMDPDTGILARSATIENREASSVTVEQAAAAAWALPAAHYTLNYLTGRWAGEWTLTQEPMHPGERVMESRRGSTGHQANPWFALEGEGASEDHGDVWFGALAWSGSWRITVEQDQLDAIRVTGGFNPFDFGYVLHPGESLETPVFYGGYSAHGLGGASRLLHHFELRHILAAAGFRRPGRCHSARNSKGPARHVQLLGGHKFNVTAAGQMALAEKAAALGVDRFVMDDGWFGQRKNDHAGLGDWYVNKQKFPHGLKPLIDKVHSLGMDFGLWVEPEMVNPDSDLYRNHPDWVLNFPGRPRMEQRNQLVLNLARPDVKAYVLGFLDKLLNENDIAFLKWDYNRNWSEPGWDQLPPAEQKRVYVEYTRNLYAILAELQAPHPKLEIEACSGGGGRVDLGILHYADEVWTSDNTDPFDRLTMQDGFSYAYTPQVMMAWVTDSPHWLNKRTTSLAYRMLSSMQGSLGIGANITKWTRRGNGHRQAPDRRLPPGAAHHCAGRPLPLDLSAQRQRVLRHANRAALTRASPWSSRSSIPPRRDAAFPSSSSRASTPRPNTRSPRSKAKPSARDARNRQRRLVDEPRPRDGRILSRRLPGRRLPPRPEMI